MKKEISREKLIKEIADIYGVKNPDWNMIEQYKRHRVGKMNWGDAIDDIREHVPPNAFFNTTRNSERKEPLKPGETAWSRYCARHPDRLAEKRKRDAEKAKNASNKNQTA